MLYEFGLKINKEKSLRFYKKIEKGNEIKVRKTYKYLGCTIVNF